MSYVCVLTLKPGLLSSSSRFSTSLGKFMWKCFERSMFNHHSHLSIPYFWKLEHKDRIKLRVPLKMTSHRTILVAPCSVGLSFFNYNIFVVLFTMFLINCIGFWDMTQCCLPTFQWSFFYFCLEGIPRRIFGLSFRLMQSVLFETSVTNHQ